MKQIRLTEISEEIEFAKKAALAFGENRAMTTYTEGDIERGCYFAVRWGLGEDCVVVLKLDDCHEPVNYANLVRRGPAND